MAASRFTRRRALAGLAGLAASARVGPARAIPGGPPIRVSGGGWFVDVLQPSPPPIHEQITFGFHVRAVPPNPVVPPNPIRGTLEYHDHAAGFRFHSDAIDTLVASGATATFGGVGTVKETGEALAFTVDLSAASEGAPATFSIRAGAYAASGAVQGGHIAIDSEGSVIGED